MQLEVKNVKTFPSREYGPKGGYSCTLYVDGVKTADCLQQGNGGCMDIRWLDKDAAEKFKAHVASLPPIPSNIEGCGPLDPEPELVIEELVANYEENQQLKRWCKTKTVYRTPDMEKGKYYTSVRKYDPSHKAALDKEFGENVEIINERFLKPTPPDPEPVTRQYL